MSPSSRRCAPHTSPSTSISTPWNIQVSQPSWRQPRTGESAYASCWKVARPAASPRSRNGRSRRSLRPAATCATSPCSPPHRTAIASGIASPTPSSQSSTGPRVWWARRTSTSTPCPSLAQCQPAAGGASTSSPTRRASSPTWRGCSPSTGRPKSSMICGHSHWTIRNWAARQRISCCRRPQNTRFPRRRSLRRPPQRETSVSRSSAPRKMPCAPIPGSTG